MIFINNAWLSYGQERAHSFHPLWEEAAVITQELKLLVFEVGQVIDRYTDYGDLFAPVAVMEQELPFK